jgi:hypothetical protein
MFWVAYQLWINYISYMGAFAMADPFMAGVFGFHKRGSDFYEFTVRAFLMDLSTRLPGVSGAGNTRVIETHLALDWKEG